MKKFKLWYSIDEAATVLGQFFSEPVSEQDVLDYINNGDLTVWWNASGKYAVELYPASEYHLKQSDYQISQMAGGSPTLEQFQQWYGTTENLLPGSNHVRILNGMYRLFTGERYDYISIPKDDRVAHESFAYGVLMLDEDAETKLQLLQRYPGAEEFSTDIANFWPDHSIPSRDSLRIAAADIKTFLAAPQVGSFNENERSKLLKQIAALAMAIAEKGGKYSRSGKPNVSQIASAAEEMIDALPDIASSVGLKNASLRESIAEGLRLITGS